MKKLISLFSLIILVMSLTTTTTGYAQWQNVGSAGFTAGTAYYTSLAIDGSGMPYVAYMDEANSSKATVMKFNGTSWIAVGSPGFSDGENMFNSLAIDNNGTPYLIYREYGIPIVMKFDGSSWVNLGSPGFSDSENYFTSLATYNGTPYVAYYDATNSGKATVKKFDGSSWVAVGSAGFSAGNVPYISLVIDTNGTPYVAYQDGANSGNATVMKFNGSSWVTVGTAGFSDGYVSYTSLAIDANGIPYVAYQDVINNSYKATVMKFNGSSWVAVGSTGFSDGEAYEPCLVINANGIPYVAYRDVANSDKATVMKFDGSSWVNVGSSGFSAGIVGNINLEIDGAGTPYVSYRDVANSDKATVMKYDVPTYTVTYNGNTSTGGTAPVDASSPYTEAATVTVLGNTGSLVKTGYTFNGWNTAVNGSGTAYVLGNTFSMPASNVALYAQWQVIPPPAITSFSPESGAIGSSVTITGSGFNTTASQNIIFFGATKAVVTAATTTSLEVTVPLGATYQYISVTNLATALSAYTSKPFNVTLAGGTSFATKADFTTGTQPFSVAIGDLDGDGKPDLAVANTSSNTVSVLLNTSTSGTPSFATKADFTTGTQPYSVAIGDLDGDGKPDLAVANYSSNTVSVLLNTSTSGMPSFATKVDFATGSFPRSVDIGDLDGDGKPDLTIANPSSNTVSVLRNTSTSGTPSFASKVDFATGTSPFLVKIGDIDGDGKPDLAVANNNSDTVSVLLNTSTSGTPSFAAKVDFATGTSPRSVAIGDIDGDGKPDLAVANYNSHTVSVLRNTSTSGTPSFAAKVDFAVVQGPNSVTIGDIDGDGKPDLAVPNTVAHNVSVLRNTSTSGMPSFATKVDFGTGTNPVSVAIGDLDGDGKPDLAVTNYNSNTVSVIRQLDIPQGSLTANGPLCTSGTGQLTFTATAGTGPFTVIYNDGTANRTATGVVSGTPFNVFINPVTSTTTYALVSVSYPNNAIRTTGFTGSSATITVNPLTTTGSESVTACGSSYVWPVNGQTYNVSGVYPFVSGCNTATLTLTLNTSSTPITATPVFGSNCPNTSITLTAYGGIAGTGSSIKWYTGPNGSGTLVGTGSSIVVAPSETTTYYVRREGLCNTTSDFDVTVNVKTFVYAANGTTTNTYCTDDSGWNHFFVGDEIIYSVQGDLSGATVGYPVARISVNNDFYQNTNTSGTSCTCNDERFEMKRSWDFDMGGGEVGAYNVRFYHMPTERTDVENAAANWMAINPACGFSYKYATPNGFYFFKNSGSNYMAPQYDGTHLSGGSGNTTNGINYSILAGITSFSGGSGAIILVPDASLTISSVAPTGATGTITICSGSSTTLTVAGGSKGTDAITEWHTGSCEGILVGTGDVFNTGNLTSDTTYYVRYSGNCNTTSCATVTVTVSPTTANAGNNGTLSICGTTALTSAMLYGALTGSPAIGGTWSPAFAGAGTYTYTQTGVAPCVTNTATVSVSLNTSTQTFYADTDGDGFGAGAAIESCTGQPEGTSTNNTDCAPTDPLRWRTGNFFTDDDNDGYNNGFPSSSVCYGATTPSGFVTVNNGIDCNDNNAAIHPGATDICGNGIDEDCNYSDLVCLVNSTTPIVSASSTTNCGTVATTLSITTGALNSATNWQWYSGSCGGTSLGSGTTLSVSPTVTTTYFARGEGGGVTPGSCGSVTITVNQCTAIPDPNFEQALIALSLDTEIDQKVITSNISGLTNLDVNSLGIIDFTGIEAFTSLTELHCNHNAFTAVNLSANTALTYLDITYNQLTSIDVAANTALTYFICQFNQITSISVATNTLLTDFSCYENPISTIDVSMLPNLRNLGVSSMNLTTLDVSSNHNLIALYAASNQLTSLNAKTGNIGILEDFQSFNNPNLSCILVDDVAVANAKPQPKWYKDATSNYTVTLNAIPTFTQVAPICSGGSLSALPATSNNGITGTWSPAINTAATTEYTFTPTAGQCAVTATMTIVVNQCAQVFCYGARVSNLTPSGANIKWYASETATTPLGATALLTTKTYYYTRTVGSVVGARTPEVVVINPTSIAGSVSGAYRAICYNSGKTLTLSATHRGNVQWQSAPMVSGTFGAFTDIVGQTGNTLNTGNLTATTYFRAVVGNGVCPSKSTAPVKVNVRLQSVAGTIAGGGATVCPGTNSTLLTLSGQVGSIQWHSSTNNVDFVSLAPKGTNASWRATNLTTTTYYKAVVTKGLGCTSATSGSVAVNVKPVTNAGTISGTSIVPYGTSVSLAVTGYDAGATLLWNYSRSATGVYYNGGQPINTSNTYTTGKLILDLYFKAVVTKDGCSSATAPFFINVGTRGKFSDVVAQSVENTFDVIAYPNPFANHFTLDVSSSSKASVEVKVYDMLGRLIETRNVKSFEMNNQEIGKSYPSGVYTINITQGEQSKTLRVIKR